MDKLERAANLAWSTNNRDNTVYMCVSIENMNMNQK